MHTFQGKEEGPGKPIPSIIVDPGDKKFETKNPGTLNCSITRAATLGTTIDGIKHTNSAIYLTGENINHHMFKDMIHKPTGELYNMIQLRNSWINILQAQLQKTNVIYSFFHVRMIRDLALHLQIKLPLQDVDEIIDYHINNNK